MKFLKALLLSFLALNLLISGSSPFSAKENEPVYSFAENNQKRIALTFDDGPHPRNTAEILSVLEKYNVKATFFVIGVNVKNYPEAFSQIVKSGHEIGNHTYSHKVLKNADKNKISKELIDTESQLIKANGSHTKLIRPPCGLYDASLVSLAMENDYKIVLWSIDTRDWAHASTDDIVRTVTKNISGGDIILFHDYVSGECNTKGALEIIIPRLLKAGYEFVTVSELLQ